MAGPTDPPGFGAAEPLPGDEAAASVRREDGVLRLLLDRGEKVLRDHPACALDRMAPGSEACVRHEFVAAFAAPRGFVVRVLAWEDHHFLWVDRSSGIATPVVERPRFSPGHRWLLAVSPSEAAYVFNGIEVSVLRSGYASRTWLHVPVGQAERFYMFSFLRWTGPESALLCGFRENQRAADGAVVSFPPEVVALRHGAHGWALQAP